MSINAEKSFHHHFREFSHNLHKSGVLYKCTKGRYNLHLILIFTCFYKRGLFYPDRPTSLIKVGGEYLPLYSPPNQSPSYFYLSRRSYPLRRLLFYKKIPPCQSDREGQTILFQKNQSILTTLNASGNHTITNCETRTTAIRAIG